MPGKNVLDGLIPVLYTALQEISRELVGIIPACMTDMAADSAAKGQVVRVPVTPPAENEDINIGTPPATGGDEFGYIDVEITKFRIGKPIVWNGEEELGVGSKRREMLASQFAQRMRSLVNEMEADVCFEASTGAKGGAYGTAGTTPFATNDMTDFAQLVKIHNDIGSPQAGRQLVLNTTAAANLRNNNVLFKVNEAGTSSLLRQGVLGQLYGFDIRESGGFKTFVPGGQNYQINGAHETGSSRIMVDSGTGIIPKGSIITIAGDPTKYIVTEEFAGTAGYVSIAPALKAVPASAAAVTIGASFLPNAAFTRDAIVFALRMPAMPEGGDEALDVTTVTDPVTGLSFQVAVYGGYRQRRIEIGAAWGCKTVNPQHSVVLLG